MFNSLNKGNPHAVTAWQLLEYMAICVFRQYCIEPEPLLEQFLNDRKAPLPVVGDDDWEGLEKRYRESRPASEWTLQSRVTIPDQCEILNPLTEEEGATALILLCRGAEKYRIRISDDHEWIVMMLDAMGRYRDEPRNIQFWSEKTGIEPGQIAGILENLVNGGFLERV
jgi:hypothetical protein